MFHFIVALWTNATFNFVFTLITLAVIGFIQNSAFTWVSRSRNSGDPNYHRYAALCSNSIWFITQLLIFNQFWRFTQSGGIWRVLCVGIIYTLSTTEGSVFMMKFLLKREVGKRKVGASG